jgi:hypothetical protein
MSDSRRNPDIETLARMAAQLAGRDPDQHVQITMAEVVVFDDLMWRYPDFLERANSAHALLNGPSPSGGSGRESAAAPQKGLAPGARAKTPAKRELEYSESR